MDIEIIKALASFPVELVLIYVIVQQQKQVVMLTQALCEVRHVSKVGASSSGVRVGGVDDLSD